MEFTGHLRRLELGDLEALVELDVRCFARPWPTEQLADELAHFDAVVIGAFIDEKLVAAVCARRNHDELWIFRIMTLPQLRRQHIAQGLLRRMDGFAHSFARPLELWLEVSALNTAAIAFYERFGFLRQNTRKEYYPNEGENGGPADALVMRRTSHPLRLDYELLDFGQGFKLERFGNNAIMRPDAMALGTPREPLDSWQYAASCVRHAKDFEWKLSDDFKSPWQTTYGPLTFELRSSQSKNIGIFPEQESNWSWLSETIWKSRRQLKVLNLFAYTGGATLACAQALAEVCHVDSARSAVQWASENAKRSGFTNSSIRWIVDDAHAFIKKELRRGRKYDGIILDPPPMGHGQGNRFEFRKDASDLILACKKLLSPESAFFLLNTYAMNLSPKQVGRLVEPLFQLPLEVGELQIKEALGDRRLSCSAYARYRRDN